MTTKAYLIVSTIIFAVTSVPLWVSVLALLISATVAIWGLSLVRRV